MSMLRRNVKAASIDEEDIVDETVMVTSVFDVEYDGLSYKDLQKFAKRVEIKFGVGLDRSAKRIDLIFAIDRAFDEEDSKND